MEELELAAKDSLGVRLFVGFEDSSIVLPLYHATEVLPDGRVVFERDPNFLSVLKEAIANGGVPSDGLVVRPRKGRARSGPANRRFYEWTDRAGWLSITTRRMRLMRVW